MPVSQAIVLCGGKGTRLGEKTKDFPKPLLPVAGRALLDRTCELLKANGIDRVILAAGFRGELIEEHFKETPIPGLDISVHIEKQPMGTSGALHELADRLDDDFLLVYGDIYLDLDVAALLAKHAECGPLATLLVRASDHPWDSHLVEIDDEGRVEKFIFEHEDGKLYRNVANAALYACSKSILQHIPQNASSDFGRDVFPAALADSKYIESYFLPVGQYVKDMGTPERLAAVEKYLEWKRQSLEARRSPKPVTAVFLDRDGTINRENGLVARADQFELIPGAGEGIRMLNQAGIRCFVVTNQPVIARGFASEKDLEDIHQKMESLLAAEGASLDGIYFSPFHPETHHGEGVQELRRASDCRKPGIGMLMQASKENGLDLAACAIIGDTANDVMAGKNAGVRTILVHNAELRDDLEPDYYADDLRGAVEILLEKLTDE